MTCPTLPNSEESYRPLSHAGQPWSTGVFVFFREVKDYFNNTFDLYESLFTAINDDYAYYMCPDRLRLPLIFYYGHTASVYVNKLVLADLVKPEERVDLGLESMFETGVDEMSWDDLEHHRMGGEYHWPSVSETREYRRRVRELINRVLDRTPLVLPVTQDSPWVSREKIHLVVTWSPNITNKCALVLQWAVFMGMEHERIHYETSSVLIRQYPLDLVTKPVGWTYGPLELDNAASPGELANPFIRVEQTKVKLGKDDDFPSYGWDNEYGHLETR